MSPGAEAKNSSGIQGFDEVVGGGVFPGKTYLVRGGPVTGKSTFCAHFVGAASNASQKALWITLSEPASQIRDHMARVGIDFSSVDFLDLSPGPEIFREHRVYEVFSQDEVEGGPLVRRVVETVEACAPRRVVIDSLSQLRIIFLRFIEIDGQIRKVIGVLKKRRSDFQKWVREFEITPYGIKIGEPLSKLRGILTGTPLFVKATP